MKTYPLPFCTLRCLLWLLAVAPATSGKAQNVTISPQTGQLIAAYTYDNEVGFERGWSSLWHHNQLPLTLTVSDKPDLTESRKLKDPAGNISLDESQNLYVMDGGTSVSTHLNISLPNGYRFTGYRLVLLNNLNGVSVNGTTHAAMRKQLIETNSSFDTGNKLSATEMMPETTGDEREYVIERTSKTSDDMGNQLYFFFWHEKEDFYGVTIKSCELFFTADDVFETNVVPATNGDIVYEGVNIVGVPFATSKLDLGTIRPRTKNGKTFYSYDYRNVCDLTACNYLYQEDAIGTDRRLPATADSGSIQAVYNNNEYFFALGNNTYYIETPTATTTQEGVSIPLGYRIVGATIEYNYGAEAGESTMSYSCTRYKIACTYISGWRRYTYYLQPDGSWSTSQTLWEYAEGLLKCGDSYLYAETSGDIVYLYGTADKTKASTFSFDKDLNHVLCCNLYLSMTDRNSNAQLVSATTNATTWSSETVSMSATNPAFTPAPYTVSLYGTDGSKPLRTITVGEGERGTLHVDSLNNDAIKFRVDGLPADTKALIRFTLQLEALNPFINSIDLVCHSLIENTPTITQQFTASDFQVAGGIFEFYVPTEFINNERRCRFSFENLYSKYGDSTGDYPQGSSNCHHARYFFVKSPYHNLYGDGKQYETTGNEPYATKASTSWCGLKPFAYSNIDSLTNEQQQEASALKEYAFSEALYKEQGGQFTDDVEIAVGEKKDCYLFTGDETRFNLAPTSAMEHRAFAYYKLNIELLVKDYRAACQLKKVYTTTCFNGSGSLDESTMYGATFIAYDTDSGEEIEPAKAYLTVDAMRTALADALREEGGKARQVLYLDFTRMYSVHMPERTVMDSMKAALNPNCLIYFPMNSGWNADNYAQLTLSGNFRACGNIVITDREPFYAPYKITVPAENYALYERQITVPMNGRAALATLMLPFTLSTTDGVHTNRDYPCTFSVNRMKAENCLSLSEEQLSTPGNHMAQAQFEPITEAHTDPNVPYMIRVETLPEDKSISFIAQEYGADIMPTNMHAPDYTFEGEQATGTINGEDYTFRNHASYAGRKLSREENVYYFAANMLLNAHNLDNDLHNVHVNPFRGFYTYDSTAGATGMNSFSVSFADDAITSITSTEEETSLKIKGEKGCMLLRSTKDCNVDITSIYGTRTIKKSLRAGEELSVSLPAGIYIVNKKKITVK